MLPVRALLSAGGRGVDEHHSANRFAAVYANDACGYAHLAEGLEQARELGYTVDKEEHVVGLNCIASAIYDDVGSVVAAISISGPSSRLTEDRFVSQGELVRDTARDISTALGLKAHP